jgi:hypothetical protein
MAAMIFKGPPQRGQCSRSISNTRLSKRAQLRRAGAAAGGASEWSAEGVWALTGTVGMISGRSLALGASTPWKRIRCNRGRGISAVSRCVLCGGRGVHGVENRQALGGAVDTIEHKAMQMDIQIGGLAETLG